MDVKATSLPSRDANAVAEADANYKTKPSAKRELAIQDERMCGEEVMALIGGHRGRSQRLFAETLEARCPSSILKSQCLLRVTAGTCCLGLPTPHSLSFEEGRKASYYQRRRSRVYGAYEYFQASFPI